MTNTQNEHVQKNLDAIMKQRYQGNTNGRQEKRKQHMIINLVT